MSKSILALPPALQAVWRDVYASSVESAAFGRHAVEKLAESAESHAWEAVRRANGGVMPEEHQTPAAKTMREALLWFADEGHYEGTYREGAGYVDACGLEKARDALGLPWERENGSLMPLAEAVKCAPSESIVAREPTEEDMNEALAPIVAQITNDIWPGKPTEAQVRHAAACFRSPVSPGVEFHDWLAATVSKRAWKAARAWGKK